MTTKLVVLGLWTILAVSVEYQGVIAQTTGPTLPFKSRLTLQNGGENAALTVHRSPLGKPCLNIEAASKRHVINPELFDHVVSVYNTCSKIIKLRVCYLKSDHCIDVEVSGQQRKDVVLGIFPNMEYFRYSYQEKF